MKTNSYWERRSEQVLLDLLKDGQKAGKVLDKDYQKALANIEEKIQILYGRFAQDNKVDTAKAMELIKGQDYQKFRYSMEEYLRRIGQGEAGLALEVNVLCMRKRITRLEEIEAEILANLALLAKRQEDVVGRHLEESLEKAYGRSLYLHYQDKNPGLLARMEKGGILINKQALQKVLETPWAGSNYSQRIWKREYDIGHKVRAAVTENILSGTSLDQVTDRVAHELKIDNQKNLYRLIYTETSYIKGQADLLAYQDLGTEEYQILATLDSRTSSICRNLDGNHYLVEEAVIGKTYPPFHPHCRTTTIRYKPKAEGTRSARGEDGKVYQVPAGLTYKDWFKKYVQSEREESPKKNSKGDYGVEWSIVETARYKKAFSKISENKTVSNSLYVRAKWALNNHDGKKTEEIYAINGRTGEEISRITGQKEDFGIKRTIKFNEDLKKAINKKDPIFLLHNHPRGYPPSLGDINANAGEKLITGLVVGHNGRVYLYTSPEKPINNMEYAVATMHFKEYNEITGMEKALERLAKEHKFIFKIIK